MRSGDICTWLDQGPVLLLEEVSIPAPRLEDDLGDFLSDPDSWPAETGWKIKLLITDEILDVHEETLNANFPLKPEGIF